MRTLFAKIMLAQVVAVVLALLVMVLTTRASLHRGFIEFLERQESAVLGSLAPALGELYAARGGWGFLRDQPQNWHRILRQARPPHFAGELPGAGPPQPGHRPRAADPAFAGHPEDNEHLRWLRSFDRLRLRQRLFLLDENREYLAGGPVEGAARLPLEAVTVGGATVGWVGFAPVREGLPPEAQRFLRGQVRVLAVSLAAALLLATGLGYALARHLSQPVRRLEDTVRDLSRGHYERRAVISSRDEIGRLGDHVNRLAQTLEQHRDARRRWVADIAHELRTPVAVLKGEIEALADGLRPPDEKTFSSLGEEIDHLSVLVNDLQSLALADAGALSLRKQPVLLADVLRQVCDTLRERMAERKIEVELDLPEAFRLEADPHRLRQLFHNLVENCARYVSPGGRVRIRLARGARTASVTVEDSGPGVDRERLPRLFERFYRLEQGRSRAGGGSGLGLSICRSIVEAHGGTIRAESSALGGLAIHVELPDADHAN